MKDPETELDFNAIKEEEETLEKVLVSLNEQIRKAGDKHLVEKQKARELTSQYVATRRAEDKALLSSDEAVAHAMRDSKRKEITLLQKQIKKPYFARIKAEELIANMSKIYEYRIGYKTNLDSRIIDWRTAPIAKLYYEYKEGDEYAEDIQGMERIGKIILRNRIEIHNSELNKFTTSQASYTKTEEGWKKHEGAGERNFARSYSQLPPILSLITPEQFRLITESAELPVFIQGIAGSGKTVVALHRIAWLLLEKNLDPKKCLILVKSPLLKNYIKNSCTLIDSDLEDATVLEFDEWVTKCLGSTLGGNSNTAEDSFIDSRIQSSQSVIRLKNSLGFINTLIEEVQKTKSTRVNESANELQLGPIDTAKKICLSTLANYRRIIELDDSKLLNKDLIDLAFKESKQNFETEQYDQIDLIIFSLISETLTGKFKNHHQQPEKYEHVFVDEIQDFSLSELMLIMNSAKERASLTMVGDISQSLTGTFPGWEKLLKFWESGSKKTSSSTQNNLNPEKTIINLSVSHRSTAQIMQLADYVKDNRIAKTIPDNSARFGRVPIWFKCNDEQSAFSAMSDWVLKAQEKYSTSATAVLCKDRSIAKYIANLLTPNFGAMVKLVDNKTTTIEEGLIVSAIQDIKGLEFCNVLIWNPAKKHFRDPILDRNLLYTALTRAEENLALVSYEIPCEFLPSFSSELVRGYDLRSTSL